MCQYCEHIIDIWIQSTRWKLSTTLKNEFLIVMWRVTMFRNSEKLVLFHCLCKNKRYWVSVRHPFCMHLFFVACPLPLISYILKCMFYRWPWEMNIDFSLVLYRHISRKHTNDNFHMYISMKDSCFQCKNTIWQRSWFRCCL